MPSTWPTVAYQLPPVPPSPTGRKGMRGSAFLIAAAALLLLSQNAQAYTPPAAPQLILNPGAVVFGSFDSVQSFNRGTAGSSDGSDVSFFNKTDWAPLAFQANIVRDMVRLDNGTYFFGGAFQTVAGMTCYYVARMDADGSISCLDEGLDGQVTSLAWDAPTETLYIGGSFSSPRGVEYTGTYMQGLIRWQGRFIAAPYYGIAGSVYAMAMDSAARKLYVAGPFGSTADTSSSVPLRKVTIASITSTTSLSTSPSPSVLIDDTISDDPSQSWLGVNGGTSTLVLDLGYSQEVSAIKLRNTRVDGRGTFEFRVTCGSLQQVRYLDEYTKNQDNTNVPKLSRLDPLVSQMYYLVNSPSCRELTITLPTYYGQGAGLSHIEVFTRSMIVDETYNTPGNSVSARTGQWATVGTSTDTMGPHLRGEVTSGARTTLQYTVSIPMTGAYSVVVMFTTCTGSCATTVTVTVGNELPFSVTPTGTRTIGTYTITEGSVNVLVQLPEYTGSNAGLQVDINALRLTKTPTYTLLRSLVEYDLDQGTLVPAFGNLPSNSMDINTLALDSKNLYAGGDFSISTSGSSDYATNIVGIVRSSGLQFPLAVGPTSDVHTITVIGDEHLFVGGGFQSCNEGSVLTPYIAIYKDNAWSAVGGGMDGYVGTSVMYDGNVYFAGPFTRYYMKDDRFPYTAHRIASYNLTTGLISAAGAVVASTTSANYAELRVFNDIMYLLIPASRVSTSMVGSIAKLNGDLFESMHGGFDRDRHQSVMGFQPSLAATVYVNGTLYAGGSFSMQGERQYANNVARYDPETGWSVLGNGLFDGTVSTMVDLDGFLLVGGTFTRSWNRTSGGDVVSLNGLALWNGDEWLAPFPTLSASAVVTSIVVDWNGSRRYVFVGGRFSTAGTVACNNVCMWDGEKWNALGLGVAYETTTPIINDMKLYGGRLYVGGYFNSAGGIVVRNLAVWTPWTGTWAPIAQFATPTNPITSIDVAAENDIVVVSGTYIGRLTEDKDAFDTIPSLGGGASVSRARYWPAHNIPSVEKGTRALPSGNVLLITGQNLLPGSSMAASMVMFDGSNYRPVSYTTTSATGTASGLVSGAIDGPYTGLATWQIALIAVFSCLFVLLIIFLIVFFLVIRPRRNKNKDKKADKSASQNSIPMTSTPSQNNTGGNEGKLIALHSFHARPGEDNELSIEQNDVITIVRADSSDWWEGELNGRRGVFPANYVKRM